MARRKIPEKWDIPSLDLRIQGLKNQNQDTKHESREALKVNVLFVTKMLYKSASFDPLFMIFRMMYMQRNKDKSFQKERG